MATFETSDFIAVPIMKHNSGGRAIDIETLKAMMAKDDELNALLCAKGVYVFSMKAGRGRKPYYVGKSEKNTFLKEAFNPRNIVSLNKLLNDRAGTLEIVFITQPTSRGKPNMKQIGEIEYLLIGHAAERNPNLINIQNKNQKDSFVIKNIYNSGKGRASKAQAEFKSLMGL